MLNQGKRARSGAGSEVSLATRAAWLSYLGGLTQEEIAGRLGVSRIKVNRLVALAHKQGLVRTFVDGEIAECVQLEEQLKERFGLTFCEVVPVIDEVDLPLVELAAGGARFLMSALSRPNLKVIGVGHGRTLAAVVDALPSLTPTDVRFVSLLGSLTRNAAANPFDVIHRLADKVAAESYFLPVPFAADSSEDKAVLVAQKSVRDVLELARSAGLMIVGIGEISARAHLTSTGMVTACEHAELEAAGAAGEVLGLFVDINGRAVEADINARTIGLKFDDLADKEVVAVAGGVGKEKAISAVLVSGVLTGLVTDEVTAQQIIRAAADDKDGKAAKLSKPLMTSAGG